MNRFGVLRSFQWALLLSHHPLCDSDHTFRIGKVRFCARCTGVATGVAIVISLLVCSRPLQQFLPFWLFLLLPLPASVDFTAHELGKWKSSNFLRFLSGCLLGFSLGWGVFTFLNRGFILLAWLVFLETVVALLLKITGKLNGFIERYERAVRR